MAVGRLGRRRLKPIGLAFAVLLLLSLASRLFLRSRPKARSPLPICAPDDLQKYLSVGRLVVNSLPHGGIGNRLFELAGFVMLAKHLNRTPSLNFEQNTAGIRQRTLFDLFPQLDAEFAHCQPHADSVIQLGRIPALGFVDIPGRMDTLGPGWREQATVRVDEIESLQSPRYFYGDRESVLRLLAFPPDAVHASDSLLPSDVADGDTNVCVHIRRGDFLYQKLHQHSTANFTLHATQLVIEKVRPLGSRVRLLLFGDDQRWLRGVMGRLPPEAVDYPLEFISAFPLHEWALAARHCDAVLLTAAISTYGWWLGYFSRNQSNVFYSSRFTKYAAPESNFKKEDFVPSDWQEIPNYDDPNADMPWAMTIPFFTRTLTSINHVLRDYYDIFFRL